MTRDEFCASIWQLMVERYTQHPDLQNICLRMQDDHGVDVVLALFLDFADRADLSPREEDRKTMEVAIAEWRDHTVMPLRQVRRLMKTKHLTEEESALRNEIKKLELRAEHLELDRIIREFSKFGTAATEHDSAERYLRECGVPAELKDQFFAPSGEASKRETPPLDGAG